MRRIEALAILVFAAPGRALCQADTIVSEMRRVDGVVQIGHRSGPVPVAGTWVVVHRIGRDRSGPLDSARTSRSGAYSIRYRAWGDESAMYIAVAQYAGIAYITTPLRLPRVTGDDAQIMVFDTTSPPYPVRVAGRHFVVTAPGEDGSRRVIEVYELMNDSTLTVVGTDTKPVWHAVLPAEIQGFQLNPTGDVTPGTVKQAPGRLDVFSAISPGIRQLSFTYTLPTKAFPLTIPMVDSVEVLEVLVQEPEASVGGAGLAEVAPVTQEGRTFRRLLGQNVQQSAVVVLNMPLHTAGFARRSVTTVAAVLAAAMALSLAFVFGWRRRSRPATVVTKTDPIEDLIRDLAAFDADFERRGSPAAERPTFDAKRVELKARLAGALAEREGRG